MTEFPIIDNSIKKEHWLLVGALPLSSFVFWVIPSTQSTKLSPSSSYSHMVCGICRSVCLPFKLSNLQGRNHAMIYRLMLKAAEMSMLRLTRMLKLNNLKVITNIAQSSMDYRMQENVFFSLIFLLCYSFN